MPERSSAEQLHVHVFGMLCGLHLKTLQPNTHRSPEPYSWVDVLPADPVEFLQHHRPMFQAFYRGGKPAPSILSLDAIRRFDLTYSCRGGKLSIPTALQPPCEDRAQQPMAPVERMATMLMKHILDSTQQQHRDSQLLNFVDHRQPHRRLPTMTFDTPPDCDLSQMHTPQKDPLMLPPSTTLTPSPPPQPPKPLPAPPPPKPLPAPPTAAEPLDGGSSDIGSDQSVQCG